MCIEMPHAQEPMAKEIPTAMRKRTRRHGKAHSTFPGTLKRRVVNTTKPSLVDPLSFLPPDGRKDQKEFIGQIKGWLVAFLTSALVGCLGLLGHSLVMAS